MYISISFLVFCLCASDGYAQSEQLYSPECNMCMDIARRSKQEGTEPEWRTKQEVLEGANSYSGEEKERYINEANCHWRKYYNDANFNPQATLTSTCADTGFCSITHQETPYQAVDITNITTFYYKDCIDPKTIIIHHTVTPTVQETIDILVYRNLSVQYIVAQNGSIYQMTRDWHGAYHAGIGSWRGSVSLNRNSVGIENVNNGASPFTRAQIDSLALLVKTLKQRWYIQDGNIIGHMENQPHKKDDPSGYFPWEDLYKHLGVFPGLFQSDLTVEEKKQVLLNNCTWDQFTLAKVQDGLLRYGYTTLPMQPGQMDENTMFNIQSFNRHYCPEIFFKEPLNVTSQTNIQNPLNRQWYGISDERLRYLLRQQ